MIADSGSPLRIAVVGAGDPTSAERLIRELPHPFSAAVVMCAPLTVERARSVARVPVVVARDRTRIEPGNLYLTSSDQDVHISDGHFVVGDKAGSPGRFDTLLRSVADSVGGASIAIVLAGRGSDGALGVQRIKEAGGWAMAEEVSGEHGEMPRVAVATGLVDLVLPVERIAARLVSSVAREEVRDSAASDSAARDAARSPDGAAETLRDILALVRVRSGHDFSSYKRATMYRRIARRMQVCECESIAGYQRYLRDHPNELANLLRDLLISVTQFFRDPQTFEVLARDVIPKLFAGKEAPDLVRSWVAGCASGEEAYSFGMLLLEHATGQRAVPQIQIFATDIDERALGIARLGCYPETIAVDLTPERLDRFFTRENGQYRVRKELRELVLFSRHNLLRDPPFSRLDLVSCRNVLIYLDRDAQYRVLTMFHFGLRSDGFLVLGPSESAEGSTIFGAIDAKHRVFVRRPASSLVGDSLATTTTRWHPQAALPPAAPQDCATPAGELHFQLLEQFAPPSALINADLDVVHLSEHAGRYFQLAGGEPSRQVMRLIRPELRLDLRTAIYAAREKGVDIRSVQFEDDNRARAVEVRVRTVDVPELGRGAILVMFAELDPGGGVPEPAINDSSIEPVVRQIEDELNRTRDQLRTTIEQYETSLEELKASNEELQAINEELRSATEELETSKEELQSVNEELTTLNHELKSKVDEVSDANSDLRNLMTSTEIGVMFLDRQLLIKRFTPRLQDLFNVIPSDVGRPLAHLTHRLYCDDLSEVAQSVLQSLRSVEREVRSRDGRSYLARWLPYRSLEDRIDGVVLTFVDVSDLRDAVAARRRSEAALLQVEERLRVALRAAPVAVFGFEPAAAPTGSLAATWGFFMGRELAADELGAQPMFAAGRAERLRASVQQVFAERAGQRVELDLVIDGATHTFDFRIDLTAIGVTAVGFDITPSKLAEITLRDADRRKDEFLATLSHELRNPLAPLQIALDVARLSDNEPAQRAQSLSIMERQVAMLTTLVNDLLDLSRITQGKIVLERTAVNVAHVLEGALLATRPMIEAARHAIQVELPDRAIEIEADFRRLVQVFTNLLANAAKYTPPGGQIGLRTRISPTTVAVHVQDDGVGISSDMLPRIFDIFVQSRDARGRSQGGLGIGLNLVRRLVELHGGTVFATSDGPGRGSTFIVELPRCGATP